jgi:CYTH domain-containing protein
MAIGKNKQKNIPIETERKFLLKRLPKTVLTKHKHEVLNIVQYYFKINNIWQRFRISRNQKTLKTKYIHTIKGPQISVGSCHEDEKTITKKLFEKTYAQYKEHGFVIEKTRYVIKHKGFKFEIDFYHGLCLVTMEVELPDINTPYEYPLGLSEEIIYELTGIKQFSNQSLAFKTKKYKTYFKFKD